MISVSVHRLVAGMFIINSSDKLEINHKDGNKLNNEVSNLEWCSRKENMFHKNEILGKHTRGERNGFSKLTEKEVIEIIDFLKDKLLSQEQIANNYGVSQVLISNINTGQAWKHLRCSYA